MRGETILKCETRTVEWNEMRNRGEEERGRMKKKRGKEDSGNFQRSYGFPSVYGGFTPKGNDWIKVIQAGALAYGQSVILNSFHEDLSA